MAYTTLNGLLKAIADAIRTKKGTTENINAQDFPAEILSIPIVVANCAISGENKVGSTLSCSTGDITSVSYQWYRGDNAISNATGKTYTLTGSDVGKTIKCKVTIYNKTVDSNTITVLTPTCSISGGTTVGNTMTCSVGNTNASVSYQWYRGDNAISNATGKTYTLTGSDVGKTIKCKVTTSGYSVWSNTSGTIDYVWTSFNEAKSASSSSHYGVTLTIDSSYLNTHKFSKLVVYTADRERTGDSFIKLWFTHNGTNYGDFQYGSNGKLSDGTTYTWNGGKNDITITFSKPISLSSLSCSCGSGVGQWRESDSIKMTMTGLKR